MYHLYRGKSASAYIGGHAMKLNNGYCDSAFKSLFKAESQFTHYLAREEDSSGFYDSFLDFLL